MVLHAGHLLGWALHSGNGSTGRGSSNLKAFGSGRYGIAVGHPHFVGSLQAFVKYTALNIHIGTAVFTLAGGRDSATKRMVHGLEAVANAENRNAELK